VSECVCLCVCACACVGGCEWVGGHSIYIYLHYSCYSIASSKLLHVFSIGILPVVTEGDTQP